VKTVSK